MSAVVHVIEPRPRDLGSFEVRRVLPSGRRRMVGPFIFFDHMGPVVFAPGQGINVRPHPHIGLATITYLFTGEIIHRDSLGYVQAIRPGDVNWMTAGRGIVHSERASPESLAQGSALHGLQLWVALPREAEEAEPSFVHHPARELPRFEAEGVCMRLIAGRALERESPVKTCSDLFYLDVDMPAGATTSVPDEYEERALYVVEGEVRAEGELRRAGQMLVLEAGIPLWMEAASSSRLVMLGGAPLDGPRHIWWNFVSSSLERIERAKADWRSDRFPRVPGESESIPLPD